MNARFPILGLLLLVAACKSSTDGASGDQVEVGPVIEEGMASFYSDKLAGRPTASGEPYDPGKNTCAHKKLKLGTRVQVEYPKTGNTATCVINDRGPFHKERIIDLSRAVAEELGIEGVGKVKIRKVKTAAEAK